MDVRQQMGQHSPSSWAADRQVPLEGARVIETVDTALAQCLALHSADQPEVRKDNMQLALPQNALSANMCFQADVAAGCSRSWAPADTPLGQGSDTLDLVVETSYKAETRTPFADASASVTGPDAVAVEKEVFAGALGLRPLVKVTATCPG